MILNAESGCAQVKASRRNAGGRVGEQAGGARWAQLQLQRAGGNNHYTESLFSTTRYRPDEPQRPVGSKGEACQGRGNGGLIKASTSPQQHHIRKAPSEPNRTTTDICTPIDVVEATYRAIQQRWSQNNRCWEKRTKLWINEPAEASNSILALPLR